MLTTIIPLILFNLHVPSLDMVPESLKRIKLPFHQQCHGVKGEMIIPPTPNCHITDFLGDLGELKYKLIGVSLVKHANPKNPAGSENIVRVWFAHENDASFLSPGYKTVRGRSAAVYDLREMCRETRSRLWAFSNAHYNADGEEIPGQRSVSVDLDVQGPDLCSNGQPARLWHEAEEPVFLEHQLRVIDNVPVIK